MVVPGSTAENALRNPEPPVPVGSFGRVEEIWDMDGNVLAQVQETPLNVGVNPGQTPTAPGVGGGNGQQAGPREVAWRPESSRKSRNRFVAGVSCGKRRRRPGSSEPPPLPQSSMGRSWWWWRLPSAND